ncbi:tetratricopeptide repeat protein [Plesiocystis pacifica]|uniref:tetratricopeptide repeat protein n=1 Tax=Plesiocystis pacifica TaxID=191768 RepID=UPI0012FCBBCB|nr:tetratricopeptide repeat protein [Plesiocystis pacifica]
MVRRRLRCGLPFAASAVFLSACIPSGYLAHRDLHYVDEVLVESPPGPPVAYESYMRARIALERDPPDFDLARGHVEDALHWQPNEPALWTLKGEIELRAGEAEAARVALERALSLSPSYPEALALLDELDGGGEAQL